MPEVAAGRDGANATVPVMLQKATAASSKAIFSFAPVILSTAFTYNRITLNTTSSTNTPRPCLGPFN
jgi:hypothetical protein